MSQPYYITTAISYPNGKPHIGHGYEAITADVIARYKRAMGFDVRFQTGTDEHGLKMAQKARDLGVTPKELADEMAGYFQQMCAALNISQDIFIRTTDEHHHIASQAIWQAMADNGDLYLDRYEGWYSVRDEAYYDESELVAGENGQKLSPQGTEVEWTVEESWFFKLSKYQQPLLDLYKNNPDFLRPERSRNEIISFVEGGLRDLSVSRTSFDWGVKVPGSEHHVMYVWVDALTNYLTGLGWPDDNPLYDRFWPANVHIIGKDIVRFHSVYWPAFLMSAGLPVPKAVFGHGFLLNDGEKMSKSLGNVIDPMDLAENFGVDQLRYFLVRNVHFGNDGTYSHEAIATSCNADLANSFGNLAQRVLSMLFKNCDGQLLAGFDETAEDKKLLEFVTQQCAAELPRHFDDLALSHGVESWIKAVFACNQYVDEQAPWGLKKTDPERMAAVLCTLFKAIRILAIAISPVIPAASEKLLDHMGVPADARNFADIHDNNWYQALAQSDFTLEKPQGLFPRIELPKAEEVVAEKPKNKKQKNKKDAG